MDCSLTDAPNLPDNDEYVGRPSNATRAGAFRQVRWVVAAESGSRVLIGATLGSYSIGEQTLARDLLSAFGEQMLVLAERNLCATRRFIAFQAERKPASSSESCRAARPAATPGAGCPPTGRARTGVAPRGQ